MSRAGKAINDQRPLPGRLRGGGKGKRDLAQPAQVSRGTPSPKTAGVALGWGESPDQESTLWRARRRRRREPSPVEPPPVRRHGPIVRRRRGGEAGEERKDPLSLSHTRARTTEVAQDPARKRVKRSQKSPSEAAPAITTTTTTRAPRLSLPPASRLLLETGTGGCRFYTESPS